MKTKTHFIVGILTLIAVNAFGGTYYVEVPEHLTDEMILINPTDEVKKELMELVSDATKDCRPDEHATVIYVRDGVPIGGDIDLEKVKGNAEIQRDDPTGADKNDVDEIDFYFGSGWQNEDQKNDVLNFLYYVEADDPSAHGAYWVARKLMGVPPLTDYEIELILDVNIAPASIWSPPSLISFYDDEDDVYIYLIIGEPWLKLKNWRWDDPDYDDDDRGVFAEDMFKIFLSFAYSTLDQYGTGMSESAGTIIMNQFSNAYPNYSELFHPYLTTKGEYRPGYTFYDDFNTGAISYGGEYFEDGCPGLVDVRKQMVNMAWYKVLQSSANKEFFLWFKDYMVFEWAINDDIPDNKTYIGDGYYSYKQPTYPYLYKISCGAWEEDGNLFGPEGYSSFDEWRKDQYILNDVVLLPQFGVFSDQNKLRCQIYFPMINGEGDYIEEPPHGDIPVKVQIQKPSGVMIYNETHYAESGNGYFEVDIPQVDETTRLDCHCEILGDASQFFEEPEKKTYVIKIGIYDPPPPIFHQVMGILPSCWPQPPNLKDDNEPNNWDIEDPNGIRYDLDVNNLAFTFNIPGNNEGLEGEYKVYGGDILADTFVKDKKSFMTNILWRAEEEFADNNGNGIPDEYEEELAEKLCPDVYIHDGSIMYWPHSAEVMVKYGLLYDNYGIYHKPQEPFGPDYVKPEDWNCQTMGDLFKKYCDEWNGDWCLTFGPMPKDDYWDEWSVDNWGNFYLDHENGISPEDFNQKVLYYNFGYDVSLRPFIQYWFFYPFNDPSCAGAGKHEGDWELVNVVISNLNPDLASPGEIVYFFHKHYLPVTVSSPHEFWQISDGTHPVVRVGGDMNWPKEESVDVEITDARGDKGYNCTGASYPRNGDYYQVGVAGSDEEVSAGKHTSYDSFELVALEPIEGNPPYWTYFPGKWGRSGGSPKGPKFHGRWRKLYGGGEDTLWLIDYDPPGKVVIETAFYDDKLEYKKQKLSPYNEKHLALLDYEKLLTSPEGKRAHNEFKHNGGLAISELKPDVCYPVDGSSERHTIEIGTNPKTIGFNVGSSTTNSPSELTQLATSPITLTQNPATTQTTIKLGECLTDEGPATISIYDISGRLIKRVETKSDYTWYLTSESGVSVSSGIYIIYIQTTSQEIVEKLAVVR